MEAIVFEEFGGPEVLTLRQLDEPRPGPGQIRIRVRAAGVNPMDYKIRNGWMESVFPTPLPAVPGIEASGVVDMVGEGAGPWAVGDEVFGYTATGSYAEYALAGLVGRKPANVSWEEAAALTVAGETALRVLGLLDVGPGDTLLVHGAAGNVGTAAVQLAVARGARVIGTASPARHDYLRGIGAEPVAYGPGLVDRVRALAPEGVSAVLDTAGKGVLPESIELRGGSTERIVTIADPQAASLGVAFSGMAERNQNTLDEIAGLAGSGTLRIPVADSFPLSRAADAQRESEAGHAKGKLVLTPGNS